MYSPPHASEVPDMFCVQVWKFLNGYFHSWRMFHFKLIYIYIYIYVKKKKQKTNQNCGLWL